jgi:hypothetical protein
MAVKGDGEDSDDEFATVGRWLQSAKINGREAACGSRRASSQRRL